MLLAFVILIIITWLAILSSIYSIFTPFFATFGDIINYNTAYYGAISAIERGQLVLKYRWPWFVWSGGWLDQDAFGKESDLILDWFRIWFEKNNWLLWSIDSRTKRIPKLWDWNVDKDLLWTWSMDYNKLDYKWVETFLLSIDNSVVESGYSLTGSYRDIYGWNSISGEFRLPPKIEATLGKLCDDDFWDFCDADGDALYNDAVVDRSLRGNYLWSQFFVMPNQIVAYYGTQRAVLEWDTMIRETNINLWSGIVFGDSKNIFDSSSPDPDEQNVISDNPAISGHNFEYILSESDYTWLQLKFALVNFLYSMSDNIYPFLEYFFEFDKEVADKFYTIEWNGRKWNYDLKIIIKKPTFKETVAGSFTVIF